MIEVQLNSNGDYWQLSWTDPTGKRIRRGIGHKSKVNRKTAKARRLELQTSLNENRGQQGSARSPWVMWSERYLANRNAELMPKTMVMHHQVVRLLTENAYRPNELVMALTPARANDVVASWRTLVGPATVAKWVRIAKTVFTHALNEGEVPVNPFAHISGAEPTPAQRERHVTIEDVTKVTQYLLEQKPKTAAGWEGFKTRAGVALMVQLGYWTGMRTGECQHTAGLLINGFQELDEDRYILYPRGEYETTKQKQRVIRIEPSLRLWWKQHGKYLQAMAKRPSNPYRVVKDAMEVVDVEPFTFADLRRTRDVIWHQTYPSHVCNVWLGHSERVAQKHYLSVSEEHYS